MYSCQVCVLFRVSYPSRKLIGSRRWKIDESKNIAFVIYANKTMATTRFLGNRDAHVGLFGVIVEHVDEATKFLGWISLLVVANQCPRIFLQYGPFQIFHKSSLLSTSQSGRIFPDWMKDAVFHGNRLRPKYTVQCLKCLDWKRIDFFTERNKVLFVLSFSADGGWVRQRLPALAETASCWSSIHYMFCFTYRPLLQRSTSHTKVMRLIYRTRDPLPGDFSLFEVGHLLWEIDPDSKYLTRPHSGEHISWNEVGPQMSFDCTRLCSCHAIPGCDGQRTQSWPDSRITDHTEAIQYPIVKVAPS